MPPLSAAMVLEVWERGIGQSPLDRALTLLAAFDAAPAESLPAWSVGERDARLAALYHRLFGETLDAYAECPNCGEKLEYNLPAKELESEGRPQGDEELSVVIGGVSLRLRQPNTLDMKAASRCRSIAEARALLARRCVVSQIDELPEGAIDVVAARLRDADPRADAVAHLTCAACSFQWEAVLDIERFLWVKINSLAKRLLREVHLLARAYGWRESDVLAMTAVRRRFYLEMAGA